MKRYFLIKEKPKIFRFWFHWAIEIETVNNCVLVNLLDVKVDGSYLKSEEFKEPFINKYYDDEDSIYKINVCFKHNPQESFRIYFNPKTGDVSKEIDEYIENIIEFSTKEEYLLYNELV